jgi:hypothetical protein
MLSEKTILLFYKDFECDRFFRNDRYIKRLVRPLFRRFGKGPKVTGFYVWYQLLIEALRVQGYDVRCNDYRAARANPNHPIGILGYPHVLDGWDLPNPAVLGPGLYDHPALAPDLMQDTRFRFFILTCEWMMQMFKPAYGAACFSWHGGIEISKWPDTRLLPKTNDVLIYDKIRWNRDRYEPELLLPIQDALRRKGLRFETIRYGAYDHLLYRKMLSESRALLFLCEHETQGMAYQEAMAANVPVLAWDNGYWLDPRRPEFETDLVPATSVPYFSAECGERFRSFEDFPEILEQFWAKLPEYAPRRYVERELSQEYSADKYIQVYTMASEEHRRTPEEHR